MNILVFFLNLRILSEQANGLQGWKFRCAAIAYLPCDTNFIVNVLIFKNLEKYRSHRTKATAFKARFENHRYNSSTIRNTIVSAIQETKLNESYMFATLHSHVELEAKPLAPRCPVPTYLA